MKKGQGNIRRPKSDVTMTIHVRDEGILVVVVEIEMDRFERKFHFVHIKFDVPAFAVCKRKYQRDNWIKK